MSWQMSPAFEAENSPVTKNLNFSEPVTPVATVVDELLSRHAGALGLEDVLGLAQHPDHGSAPSISRRSGAPVCRFATSSEAFE